MTALMPGRSLAYRLGVSVLALLGAASAAAAQQMADRYRTAERMLSWHAEDLIVGDEVDANWLDGSRFWYRSERPNGAFEFLLVDPAQNTRAPVFDNARLAAAMSLANDTSYDPVKLPFDTFEFVDGQQVIAFQASERRFRCNVNAYRCTVGDTLPDQTPFVVSPDSAWQAFVHEHNVYIRPFEGGDSIQLTTDGAEYWSYGLGAPRPRDLVQGEPRRPEIRWSPDSRLVAVVRADERNVGRMHLVSSTHQRPKHYAYPYALPGDTILPRETIHVIDVQTQGKVVVDVNGADAALEITQPSPVRIQLDGARDSLWSADSGELHFTTLTRGSKRARLLEANAATGAVRVLTGDSSDTFVELGQRGPDNWHVTDDGEDVIWWSERDGWAHLYRYDGSGNLTNRITEGPWTVAELLYVDEASDRIYFTARGREPDRLLYYRHLYRVGFDGSGLTLLTPEDADHEIDFSPSGEFFIDTYSRIEQPPVTVLRAAEDGRVIRTLEQADVSALQAIGWQPAEVFKVKARDGVTDIYGVMYKPTDFDPTKTYPIIDHIYPGPQIGSVGSWEFKGGGEEFSLAQLGFIVIEIDHMGTPFRSKAFHDFYYGNMGDNGIPDHMAALKQLAARHAFLDLDRVGIYGHSGGGFASTDAILRYPDFFDVAVSSSGNHDNRSYGNYWGEKYQGLLVRDTVAETTNYRNQVNALLAENLEGDLLLMHGDLDDNVHPAMTIQLVDALIEANEDFDLIIAPDRFHGLGEPYFIRRRWDYFVERLLGESPPENYEITRPEN